jgi:cathepsin E
MNKSNPARNTCLASLLHHLTYPPSLTLVMFFLASVAPFIVLASTVVANPIVVRDSYPSLSLKKHVKSTGTGRNLVHGHQGRANDYTASLSNTMISTFQVSVGVGTPPTNCGSSQPRSFPVSYTPFTDNLVVDTGSANTWVGADKAYVKTHTGVETYNSVVSIVFFQARA